MNVNLNDLKESLKEERKTFASWDDGRRRKVDIVLEAIKRSEPKASLDELQEVVMEVANEKEEYKELESSVVKMLRIHYLALNRTYKERAIYKERKKRALERLRKYRARQ